MTLKPFIYRLFSIVLVVGLSFPAPLWADPQKAADYYQQATEAYEQGDLEKAADLLNSAYAEDPDLVYQYNRILALQGLGRYEEALQVAAALEAPMKADPQNRFEDIAEIKAELESQVEKERSSQTTETTEVTDPPDDGTVTTEETVTPEKKGPNLPAIILLGAGGALLIPGLIFVTGNAMPGLAADCLGIAPRTADDDACAKWNEENRGGEPSPTVGHEEALKLQTTHGVISIVMLAVSGAAIAGGLVLMFLGNESEAAALLQPNESFTVAPYVTTDGAGAAFQLRF